MRAPATLAQPLKKSWKLAGTTGSPYRAVVSADVPSQPALTSVSTVTATQTRA